MNFKRYSLLLCYACLCLAFTTIPISSPFRFTAFAHSSNAQALQGTCLQAPASLDPTKLTHAQLKAYGLPDEYLHTVQGKHEWLHTIDRLKRDRHICNASLSATDRTWFQAPLHQRSKPIIASASLCGTNPPSNGHGCDFPNQAGNWALGDQNQYISTSTNYNLPCPKNTSTINNGQANWWIGLGGGLGDTGGGVLVQAGNEIHIDSHGNISFVGFFESTGPNFDDIYPFSMPTSKCSNSMSVYLSDTGSDYFIMDGGGVNLTQNFSWPQSDGITAECVAERSYDKAHGYWLIFVDFNYIAFTNCEVDSDPIGQVNHYYTSMIDSQGNVLASPGPISSNGLNFNLNWKQVGCTC